MNLDFFNVIELWLYDPTSIMENNQALRIALRIIQVYPECKKQLNETKIVGLAISMLHSVNSVLQITIESFS